jgi:hypothetical protein
MSKPILVFLSKDEAVRLVSNRLADLGTQFSNYPERLDFMDIDELLEELEDATRSVLDIRTVIEDIKKKVV